MQSKRESMREAITSSIIGYVVAVISQMIVYPIFDIHVPIKTHLGIGAFFILISMIKNYIVRRFYNARHPTLRLVKDKGRNRP